MGDHRVDELLKAFRAKDWTQLQELAASGVDINGFDDNGLTTLMRAATAGEAEVVQAILESGANIDLRSATPVESPSASDGMPRLGERPPKHADWKTEGKTALFLAAETGHLLAVDALVEAGADLELEDRQGDTPLLMAAASGQAPVVAHLVDSVPAAQRTTAADAVFEAALNGGHADVAERAIEAGASNSVIMGSGTMTTLYAASLRGHGELVKVLLKAGADARIAGARGTPLIAGLRQGHDDVVRALAAHHRVRGHQLEDEARALPLHIAVKEAPSAPSLRRLLPLGFEIEGVDPALNTPLQLAAAGGHVDMIEALNEAGATIDGIGKPRPGSEMLAPRDAGRTPLMLAAAEGHLDAVNKLIDLGADPTTRIDSSVISASAESKGRPGHRLADEGSNALMLAAKAGHLEVVRSLLQADTDLEVDNYEGHTAILLANDRGHQEVVDLLTSSGASTVALGPSSLIAAILSGNTAEVNALLEAGVRPDVTTEDQRFGTRTALHLAAEEGHLQIVMALLRARADVDTAIIDGLSPFDRTAMHLAAAKGHDEIIRTLLSHGAAFDSPTRTWDGPGDTPLAMAAEAGHAEVIAALAKAGADLTGGTAGSARPLTTAAGAGHVDAVRELITRGAPVAAGRQEALVEASNGGHLEVVGALLDGGADSNQFPPDSWSALTAAVANNHLEIARRLLAAGADPDGGRGGLGPLDQAIMNGHLEIVQLLIDAGADVNRRGSGGKTPLMDAIKFHPSTGDEISPLLSALVTKGADLNAQNERGETALHLAIDQSKVDDANFLIAAEPDLSLADLNGRTALSRAIERGFGEMAAILQSKGAAGSSSSGDSSGTETTPGEDFANNRELPVDARRGIDLEDGDDTLILVKAPLEAVTRAFQLQYRAEDWERDVSGKEVVLTERCYLSLRLVGHHWTVIRACYLDSAFSNLTAEDAKAISESTSAPSILFQNSDNASVVGYTYFENGEEQERFFYDPESGEWDAESNWEEDDFDEDDDSWEVEEEEGWEGPPPKFLSLRRQLDTRQIEDPWEFVDAFLKEMEAFAPSLEIVKAKPGKEFTLSFDGFSDEDFERLDFVALR